MRAAAQSEGSRRAAMSLTSLPGSSLSAGRLAVRSKRLVVGDLEHAATEGAVKSLDNTDPEGTRFALNEAAGEIEAAARDAETTQLTLAAAREGEPS